MEKTLNKRQIMDPHAPNRSTSIINGQSSNVLNWDDTRFPWAYNRYKSMLANFWTPFEINMQTDKKQFPKLTVKERDSFLKIIGLLALLDSIQTDYAGKVADYLTDSSLSALMTVLAFQEVVHNQSYSYVLSSLVDKREQDEVFDYWRTEPTLRKRNDFVTNGYKAFTEHPTIENFLKSIVFDVILEGLFFYSGFAYFYNLARNQKMVSSSTMINYINRDEQIHVGLFVQIFEEVLTEYPDYQTKDLQDFILNAFKEAVQLEIEWAETIIGNEIEGLTLSDVSNYVKFTANTRCSQFGVEKPYPEISKNPLRWIKAYSEVDLGKSDFFEQRSRQYTKTNLVDNGFDEL